MTRLLVLGGSRFVGRAVVDDGLRRNWDVTVFNRGRSGARDPRVRQLTGDREHEAGLGALSRGEWEYVVDTWSAAPLAALHSARAVAERAARYAYISSISVYAPPPPIGVREDAPTVDSSPGMMQADYAEAKRGAELAVVETFGERALVVRPGLILGPHEDVGRLPWWLMRIARGSDVLAPGPPDRPLQYIDARDLARFVLDAAAAGEAGPFNAVSRPGHATTGTLLETCVEVAGARDARLRWLDPAAVLEAGIEPWTELPIWLPPDHEFAGMHAADVERAHAAGLRCRPLHETVADTWAWLSALDGPPPLRQDLPAPGLSAERERMVLARAPARDDRA
jgi:2'-hydroxyisoflavone reductase